MKPAEELSNPYKSPEYTHAPVASEVGSATVEFRFSGEVGERDLRALNPRAPILILLGMVLVVWGPELLDVLRDPPNFSSGPGGFLTAMLDRVGAPTIMLLITAVLIRRIWTAPKRLQRAMPNTTGEIRGRLTNHFIELQSPHASIRSSLDFVSFNEIKPSHLSVSTGSAAVLPARLFNDFEGARQLATEARRSATRVNPHDPRFAQPVPADQRLPVPADAIAFDGPIYGADLQNEYVQQAMTASRRSTRVGLLLVAAGLVLVCLLYPVVWFFGGPALIIGVAVFVRRMHESRRQAVDSATPTFYPCGWISSAEVMSHTTVGWGRYRWSAFRSQILVSDTDTLVLALAGTPETFLLLNRRQFETLDDWDRAVATARQYGPSGHDSAALKA